MLAFPSTLWALVTELQSLGMLKWDLGPVKSARFSICLLQGFFLCLLILNCQRAEVRFWRQTTNATTDKPKANVLQISFQNQTSKQITQMTSSSRDPESQRGAHLPEEGDLFCSNAQATNGPDDAQLIRWTKAVHKIEDENYISK